MVKFAFFDDEYYFGLKVVDCVKLNLYSKSRWLFDGMLALTFAQFRT